MKKFSLTSSAFEGAVYFEFNDLDMLSSYDISKATLSPEQQSFILKVLPTKLEDIKRVLGNSPTAKLTEVTQEVTFERFWNRYDEKIRSSKKKALQKWNRLSQGDRNRAFNFIATYEMSIPNGVPKKYAETYLNSEIWNN